jgi:hypothetical protein
MLAVALTMALCHCPSILVASSSARISLTSRPGLPAPFPFLLPEDAGASAVSLLIE